MDYKYCVRCGTKLRLDAKFCDHCGAKQPKLANENNKSASVKETPIRPTRESLHRQQEKVSAQPEPTEAKEQAVNSDHNRYGDGQATYNSTSGASTSFAYNESGHPNLLNSFDVWVKNALHPNVCMGRADYWWGYLAVSIFSSILFLIACISALIAEQSTASILFLVPTCILTITMIVMAIWCTLAAIERIHDTGKSGWNFCCGFIPLVGGIILLIICCQPTNNDSTRWPRP